jgi:hypothetical protein
MKWQARAWRAQQERRGCGGRARRGLSALAIACQGRGGGLAPRIRNASRARSRPPERPGPPRPRMVFPASVYSHRKLRCRLAEGVAGSCPRRQYSAVLPVAAWPFDVTQWNWRRHRWWRPPWRIVTYFVVAVFPRRGRPGGGWTPAFALPSHRGVRSLPSGQDAGKPLDRRGSR